jgi:hypothetical protein
MDRRPMLIELLGVPGKPLDDRPPPGADLARGRTFGRQALELAVDLRAALGGPLPGFLEPGWRGGAACRWYCRSVSGVQCHVLSNA